jgi:glycerol transport system substrate-binding protein
MDDVLARLQRTGMTHCPPKLNEVKDAKYWFDQPGAPKAKLANEKPKGETVPYETLLAAWKAGKVR